MVGLAVLVVAFGAGAPTLRAIVIGGACDITACSSAGMTTAGWFVVVLPAIVIAVVAKLWSRLGRVVRAALVLLTVVPTASTALSFLPGRRQTFDDLVRGPGSDQFAGGMVWAIGALVAALVLGLTTAAVGSKVPAVDRWFRRIVTVTSVIVVLAALPVAVSQAGPTYVRAGEIFPATIEMNGDTLTRTMIRDERGCTGVLPDDRLLNRRNCHLTVHAGFTTDDSDAVVTFRAVLYRDDETADRVRAGLPDRLTPAGVPAESVTVVSTTGEWVLVGTAAHADGRPIASADRGWVLWPLRQVSYYFIGTRVGLMVEPDPKDGIAPRST